MTKQSKELKIINDLSKTLDKKVSIPKTKKDRLKLISNLKKKLGLLILTKEKTINYYKYNGFDDTITYE